MTGLWIALSVRKTAAEISSLMALWFPNLLISSWDLSSTEQADKSLKDPKTEHADILFQIYYNKSEFPTGIHLDKYPGPQDEAVIMPVMIELARRFARAYNCRSICDGSGYGDTPSPYWDIIWDNGKSFLADDCDTEFGDQSGGAVRIIREISLPSSVLDGSGRLTR